MKYKVKVLERQKYHEVKSTTERTENYKEKKHG